MVISDALLNQIKCCLSTDGHIVIEPVVLKCGGNACRECAKSSPNDCFSCNHKHEKTELLNAPANKFASIFIKSSLHDLFEYIEVKLDSTCSLLTDESIIGDINTKFEAIENEMDIRVKSIIDSIHKYRDQCKTELDKTKEELKKKIEIYAEIRLKKKNQEKSYEFFIEKQNELKSYQKMLNGNNAFLDGFKFEPSKFRFTQDEFGKVFWVDKKSGLDYSIKTNEDNSYLNIKYKRASQNDDDFSKSKSSTSLNTRESLQELSKLTAKAK